MNILVIGGHGFIGSHFCKAIKKKGVRFDIYDIGKPNGKPNDWTIRQRKEGLPDSISMPTDMASYTHVVYFASMAGIRNQHEPLDFIKDNVLPLQSILNQISPITHITYISSSSVFGDIETEYSLSKRICEGIVMERPLHCIVRPFTVYGAYGRPEMLVTQCAGGGDVLINGDPSTIRRRFTYVGDLVEIILDSINDIGVINAIGAHEYKLSDVLKIFDCEWAQGAASPYDFNSQNFNIEIAGRQAMGKHIWCRTRIEDVKTELIEGNKL